MQPKLGCQLSNYKRDTEDPNLLLCKQSSGHVIVKMILNADKKITG